MFYVPRRRRKILELFRNDSFKFMKIIGFSVPQLLTSHGRTFPDGETVVDLQTRHSYGFSPRNSTNMATKILN